MKVNRKQLKEMVRKEAHKTLNEVVKDYGIFSLPDEYEPAIAALRETEENLTELYKQKKEEGKKDEAEAILRALGSLDDVGYELSALKDLSG